ncbi:MAG: response regulator transcription factor [Thermoleophilia bacterium]|nr:response regulator transcription factor [Thermoleophilia bacterium]
MTRPYDESGQPNKRIVVIDDDPSVQEVVRAYLEKDGYHVFVAGTATEGLRLAERIKPGLVVLDLMLPDRSGEDVCREVRRRSDVPILMLTAKASEDERVTGLALGADDYLTKPFSPRELVARVRAILRRTLGGEQPLVEVISLDGGELEIDTVAHEVRKAGEPVELTPSEYKLLTTLARYPGRVYSRFELINHVQGYDYEGYERTIDAHVKNLRRKIEPDPKHPRYVETVFGVGYRLKKQ